MGRSRRTAVNQYKARKEARLRGKRMAGRSHESAPWFTFRVPGASNPDNVDYDPVHRMERELTKFGERAEFFERQRRNAAAARATAGLVTTAEELEEAAG